MLHDIVNELLKVKDRLENATREVTRADRSYVEAKIEYTRQYARAYLGVKGTVTEREATATLETADALFDKEVADWTLRAAKENLRTLRDQMEILRSISAAERAQFASDATGQWT